MYRWQNGGVVLEIDTQLKLSAAYVSASIYTQLAQHGAQFQTLEKTWSIHQTQYNWNRLIQDVDV